MTSKINYGTEMPELVEAAHKDPEAWHRAMWGTMEATMTTCVDCGDDHPTPHNDPRNPPLDEGPCLCQYCYESALLEVLDDSLDALKNALQLSIGVIRDPIRTLRLQRLIELADNV